MGKEGEMMQPQFPMQQGMRPQMRPGMGGNPFMGMNQMNQMPRSPFMGPMMGRPQMNRGGGLFSRLLGGGNQARGMNGLMGMQQAGRGAGGLGSMLTNPGGLSNFLNNTQQVLQTAQSIGPMIQQFQQYGSLIRNIPAMWKLYQGFKNNSNDQEGDTKKSKTSSRIEQNNTEKNSVQSSRTSSQKDKSSSNNKKKQRKASNTRENQIAWSKQSASHSKGTSTPKLYI